MPNYQVGRGGSWYDDDATNLAARVRFGGAPSSRSSGNGFRCTRMKSANSRHVIRGGRWYFGTVDCIAVYRGDGVLGFKLGFRAVRRRYV